MKAKILTISILALLLIGTLVLLRTEAEVTKIGVFLPLTGGAAVYGEAVRDGILLYNEQNPDDKIELFFEDSKCEAGAAITAVNKLLDINEVDVIIGAACSPATLATAPITENRNVFHLSPISSSPDLTKTHVFRLFASDVFQAKEAADLMEKLQYSKVGVLFLENEYGSALKDKFVENWKERGKEITKVEAIQQDGIDYRTQILKVSRTAPDVIYVIGYVQELGVVAKQMEELKIKMPVISTESVKDDQLFEIAGQDAVEGIKFLVAKEHEGKEATKFKKDFQLSFGKEPGLFADYGYDSMLVINEALQNTDGSKEAIKNFLVNTNFTGATGKIDFDDNGDVEREYQTMIVEDGGFRKI